MAEDPNKVKDEQNPEGGYNYEKEVETINESYGEAEQALTDSYGKQEQAVENAYGAQMGGYADFLDEVTREKIALGAQDEKAQKRAEAFRYIAGIGDTISSVANLVGTAHGAANQPQYYNAPEVIQKAEAARRERKLEADKLNERMDELKAQMAAIRSTKDLKLGELEGKKASELLGLELQKGRDLAAAAQAGREEGWRKKQFDEGVRQFDETKELQREQMKQNATQHAADIASREKIAKANAEARQEAARLKILSDPKKQAAVLVQNIVGVRDELAQKMGYKDYNEYLRYQQGGKVDDVGRRAAKKTREERASKYPEIEQMMLDLSMPDDLDGTKLAALVTASKVFADAMDKAAVVIDPTEDPNL